MYASVFLIRWAGPRAAEITQRYAKDKERVAVDENVARAEQVLHPNEMRAKARTHKASGEGDLCKKIVAVAL